jgi:hypothetical protein
MCPLRLTLRVFHLELVFHTLAHFPKDYIAPAISRVPFELWRIIFTFVLADVRKEVPPDYLQEWD